MVVGQDWSSKDTLERDPCEMRKQIAKHGYNPCFPTNKTLDKLLCRHLNLKRGQCYLTNLFPFIKPGRANARIGTRELVWSARTFTLPEIEIVSPDVVICLGLATFRSLKQAKDGVLSKMRLGDAIAQPFPYCKSEIRCVAHPGSWVKTNRSLMQVDQDWQEIAKTLERGAARGSNTQDPVG
jgi:restriction system protein